MTQERERSRLDVARISTEKETLQVTLDRREKELKAKREEFKKEVVRMTGKNNSDILVQIGLNNAFRTR